MGKEKDTLYLKAERHIQVEKEVIKLSDVAKMTCSDSQILNHLKTITVYKFKKDGEKRKVISILKLIECIHEVYPDMTVENLGETDIVMEQLKVAEKKGMVIYGKVVFVSLIAFFGTAFTIMAFHNDIGIQDVFDNMYMLIMGESPGNITMMEVSYSIGLAVGITLFFNHIGGRRITKDPTPIEVEMRTYESNVNTALVETSNRERKSLDVD